jgi:outer membrane protein OmpA-like peptidoglycan-associated protein
MDDNEKFLIIQRFIDFFDREVLGGRLELVAFSEELLTYLKDGNSIKISIKGFASPRATSAYNRILSMRRISSVKNHFNSYNEGVFLPFMRSGQFSFEEEALGESTADLQKVSEELNDLKGSVYSISASLERRVEITNIVIDEKTASKN